MHVVGTAGHVDHGKSTLVEALTGIDPDRFEEEKRRGLTIDLGFAWCTLPSGRTVGFVDVPGHERFIRNMLAGAGGIDVALFVVAADEGWMPQSAEHLDILDFLEVSSGVVALTKTDRVEPEMVEIVTEEIEQRLAPTTLAGAEVVAVSAPTGRGLREASEALDAACARAGEPVDHGRPRLFIDRRFTIAGAGTVVTGTLTGGRLRVGHEATILPHGHRARIRSLQTHNEDVTEAVPGSRVAVNLVGLDRSSVVRGDVLVTEEWPLTVRFLAKLRVARGLSHHVTERGAYHLHAGSAETSCRLRIHGSAEQAAHRRASAGEAAHQKASAKEAALAPGASACVEVFLDDPVPLVWGDRFVIRDAGRERTVAGGTVLDPEPPRLRRHDPAAVELLEHLERDPVTAMVTAGGSVDRRKLALRTGMSATQLEATVERTESLAATPSLVFTAERMAYLAKEMRRGLAKYHTDRPLAPGMPLEELREVVDEEAFDELLERWGTEGRVVVDASVARLPDHRIALDPDQRERADRALAALREAGTTPPSPAEVGLDRELTQALRRNGEVVVVSADLVYPADVWTGLERAVVELIERSGPATVSQVRDATGTSRKYAVPVLEHLDATRITVRRGDLRDLGPRAEPSPG